MTADCRGPSAHHYHIHRTGTRPGASPDAAGPWRRAPGAERGALRGGAVPRALEGQGRGRGGTGTGAVRFRAGLARTGANWREPEQNRRGARNRPEREWRSLSFPPVFASSHRFSQVRAWGRAPGVPDLSRNTPAEARCARFRIPALVGPVSRRRRRLCNHVQNPSAVWTIPHGAARVGPSLAAGPARPPRARPHCPPRRARGKAPPGRPRGRPGTPGARHPSPATPVPRVQGAIRWTGPARRGATPSPKRRPPDPIPAP
jgi:hypothetical protein